MILCIYLFSKFLFIVIFVLGIVLGVVDIEMNNINFLFFGVYILESKI